MQLLYDPRDAPYHERLGSQILYWLDDLGAVPLNEAGPQGEGFLFAGARPMKDYRHLVAGYPLVRNRPEVRQPILRLTRRPPFKGASASKILHQVIEGEPTPPSRLQPQVPPAPEARVMRCQEKQPAKRCRTAEELTADLGRFLQGQPVMARQPGVLERSWRWCRRLFRRRA